MHLFRPVLAILLLVLATTASAEVARPREAADRMVAAVAARDADAIAALYATGAILLGPNQPVTSGREAIRDSWLRSFAGGYSALSIVEARTETGADRAAMALVWEATIQPQGGAAQVVRGRSLIYFTQTAQGWLISADMWQPAP